MGYWKDVAYDISRGMSKEKAEYLNAVLRYGKETKQEKQKLTAIAEAELKINKKF